MALLGSKGSANALIRAVIVLIAVILTLVFFGVIVI